MLTDETETLRRALVAEINTAPSGRAELEARHGHVWSSDELDRDFEVLGFRAPLVAVRRRSDGQVGSLYFQHSPRLYFGFAPDPA